MTWQKLRLNFRHDANTKSGQIPVAVKTTDGKASTLFLSHKQNTIFLSPTFSRHCFLNFLGYRTGEKLSQRLQRKRAVQRQRQSRSRRITMNKLTRKWRNSHDDRFSLPTLDDSRPIDTQGPSLSLSLSLSLCVWLLRKRR